LFFVTCIVLIGTVLLQPGKTDAGALFTSNISNAAFGPRGTASVLSKITIVAASVFMLLALLISMPALQGGVSVLQTTGEAPAEQPATNTAPSTEANSQAPQTSEPASNSNAAPANQ
jgi:preprotein translocase subunit SecG